MVFDPTEVLARASSREKSDVANKLVSMVLHKLSQECPTDMTIRSQAYRKVVKEAFGSCCPYCGRSLEPGGATIAEHLDAMNRYRAGLHVPGNVLPACKTCNLKKRRDDQRPQLHLSDTGWGSFLSHDGTRCEPSCSTCEYWSTVLAPSDVRSTLQQSRQRLETFRAVYLPKAAPALSVLASEKLREFYSGTQDIATQFTTRFVNEVLNSWKPAP